MPPALGPSRIHGERPGQFAVNQITLAPQGFDSALDTGHIGTVPALRCLCKNEVVAPVFGPAHQRFFSHPGWLWTFVPSSAAPPGCHDATPRRRWGVAPLALSRAPKNPQSLRANIHGPMDALAPRVRVPKTDGSGKACRCQRSPSLATRLIELAREGFGKALTSRCAPRAP